MTQKEKLIKLIINAKRTDPETGSFTEYLADHLLENGVIVPPVKVGDTVYYIEGAYYRSVNLKVRPIKVTEISQKASRSGTNLGWGIIANGIRYKFSSIGKTVFLSRNEAEQALKERSRGDA